MAKTHYKDDDCVTTYEEKDGCGGCKNSTASTVCKNCYDFEKNRYLNFEGATDYWKRK